MSDSFESQAPSIHKKNPMSANGIDHVDLNRYAGNDLDQAFGAVKEAIRGVQFGSVTVIIQDSRIIQVDRTEKLRVAQHRPNGRSGRGIS